MARFYSWWTRNNSYDVIDEQFVVFLAQRGFFARFPGRPTPTGSSMRRLATRVWGNKGLSKPWKAPYLLFGREYRRCAWRCRGVSVHIDQKTSHALGHSKHGSVTHIGEKLEDVPLQSADSPDFFLLGNLKSRVYVNIQPITAGGLGRRTASVKKLL